MADQNQDQEKTEEPTERKLKKARDDGNVSKSQELSSTIILMVASLSLALSGTYLYRESRLMFLDFLLGFDQPVDNVNSAVFYMQEALGYALRLTTPIMVLLFATAIIVTVIQTGPVFTTKVLEPKPNRLDPFKGLKRLFSMKGLVELIKGFSKILIVGIVIYYTLVNQMDMLLSLSILPLQDILATSGGVIVVLVTRIIVALFVLSIADAAYQRYQHRKDLRMSKQEVKDEFKQMEGDPMVKSSRRRAAAKMSQRRRLDHAVLNSDVVVTNPTHYSVALRYDPDNDEAPIVMAKGMRLRAQKIREFAQQYDIPILENPPVARALYSTSEEEQAVPPDLYQAVAEILAYVFKMRNKDAA